MNNGAVQLNSATITFSGTAASSTSFLTGVKLLDPSGNAVTITGTSTACSSTTSCTINFNFAGRQISSAQTFKLTVNDSLEAVGSANTSVSLYTTLNANTDLTYTDAIDGTGASTTLPSILQPGNQIFPLNLNSVAYTPGI